MATGNAINANSTGLVRYNGTGTFDSVTVTQHDLLIGAASNGITSVAPAATSGVPVISQGASADPAFGTAVVAGGGTGNASQTAYSVVCGGTSTTGAFQAVAPVATGQVLVSGGASALPAFSATPTVTSITLGSGSAFNTYTSSASWTPALKFGGAATGLTYTFQQGTYIKIGQMVFIRCQISLSAKGSSTGVASITGLPFASINDAVGNLILVLSSQNLTMTAGYTGVFGFINNSSQIDLYQANGAAAPSSVQFTDAAFANTTTLYLSGSYFATA